LALIFARLEISTDAETILAIAKAIFCPVNSIGISGPQIILHFTAALNLAPIYETPPHICFDEPPIACGGGDGHACREASSECYCQAFHRAPLSFRSKRDRYSGEDI
jgi:hypothetical protein